MESKETTHAERMYQSDRRRKIVESDEWEKYYRLKEKDMNTEEVKKLAEDTEDSPEVVVDAVREIAQSDGPYRPIDFGAIKQIFMDFQRCKAEICDPEEDFYEVHGKAMINRSGLRKIQTAFRLSDEIVSEEYEYGDLGENSQHIVMAKIRVRVWGLGGRQAEGIGLCSFNEPGKKYTKPDHDIPATAHTRAKNRAIADLVGGGVVSAEEMVSGEDRTPGEKWKREERGPGGDPRGEKNGGGEKASTRQIGYLCSLMKTAVEVGLLSGEDYEIRKEELQSGKLDKWQVSKMIENWKQAIGDPKS